MEENKFRCHFSIIIENLGSVFWFAVLLLINQLDSMGEVLTLVIEGEATIGELLIAAGAVIALIVVVLLCNWFVWSKTWISIEEEAIVIERRMLNRKVNTIGIKNISNINMEQNLFERIVGTYKIKLDTNSATTADSTDVKIVLSKNKAEEFKRRIMERMNAKTEIVPIDTSEYDVSYSVKDIAKHCFYTANMISVLFIIGVLAGVIIALQMVDTGTLLLDGIVNVLGSIAAFVIVIGSVLHGLVKDFFVYYDFKAKRQDNKIYMSYGLFKKRQYTLAVDKINAVEVVSTTLSRLLKRQYVKLICVGVGDEENENSMLLLSETREEMERKLSVLLPEFILEAPKLTKREKQSLWSELPGMIITSALVIAVIIIFSVVDLFEIKELWIRIIIAAVAIFILVSTMVGVYLNFRTCGIGLGNRVLVIQEGSFQKVSTWIPYRKIQELEYTQGPIGRRFGYAKGTVYVLAKVLDSMHLTTFYKTELFDEIRKRMLRRKANS